MVKTSNDHYIFSKSLLLSPYTTSNYTEVTLYSLQGQNMAQQTFSLASRVKLSNGISMPQIHLGLYLTSGNETLQAVLWALEVRPNIDS